MDDVVEVKPQRAKGAALVGAGLVAGMVLAGLATADAQTPTPTPSAQAEVKPSKEAKEARPHRDKGMRGRRMMGKHLLHGEAVVRAPGGGFRTLAMQHGVVTALSATSVAVRSEDGFARTYARNAETRVGDEVAVGDTVHVVAVVEGANARALRVREARGRREAKPTATAAT